MQQVINGTVLGSIYVLFALGLSLSWGVLNVLNLAHGALFMFSGFSAFLITQHVTLSLFPLILLCMAVAGVLTLTLEILVFGHIRRTVEDVQQAELLMLIASVGAAAIPVTIAQNETHSAPFGLQVHYRTVVHHFGDIHVSNTQVLIVVVGLLLTGAVGVWVKHSRSGRALRALAYDAETCSLMGVDAKRLGAATMFVSGALAGLACVLLMLYLGSLTPESGDSLLVKGFAIIILGGVGSVWGTLAGAVVLAAAETVVLANSSGGYTDAVSFALIILVILLRPQGLIPQQKVTRV